ncbi:MAG: hypothetical protein AB8G86_18830 [Saprospiraceae bacterium]
MDLLKEWQQLHQEKFNYSPIEKEKIMKAIYQESNSTIATLKKRLKGKLAWIVFFLVAGSIWMLFSLDQPELLMIQGAFMAMYLLGLIVMGLEYRKMDNNFNFSDQTLAVMKKQDQVIKRALGFEKIWGIVSFPLAILGGLLIGNHSKGHTLAEFFQDPKSLGMALVLIIVLVPLMYFLTGKMNQYAYGNLMDDLQNNIRRMEDLA